MSSELEEYLKAKLNRQPAEKHMPNPLEKYTSRVEVSLKYSSPKSKRVSQSDSDADSNSEDYSPGSSFWKNAAPKKVEVERSRPSRPKQVVLHHEEIPSPSKGPSVASLLRKLKDVKVKPTEIIQDDATLPEDGVKPLINIDELFAAIKESSESLLTISRDYQNVCEVMREKAQLSAAEAESNSKMLLSAKKIDELDIKLDALSQQVKNLGKTSELTAPVAIHPQEIDRPTKNLLFGLNDKIIQLSKLSDHNFESCLKKLAALEKPSSSLTASSSPNLQNLEQRISQLEQSNEEIKNMLKQLLERTHQPIEVKVERLENEVKRLQFVIKDESKITHDRMAQFMNMFSILESSRSQLLQLQCSNQPENYTSEIADLNQKLESVSTLVKTINATLVKYLPLNLESKLHKIEQLLQE